MKSRTLLFVLFVYFCKVNINALSFPGPQVYVVTPSTRLLQKDENKVTPFYYHKWMRRMDTEENVTTSKPTIKIPDLIFAEFESDGNMQKSIRKLLEKEKIAKPTTMSPIYVPESEEYNVTRIVNYGLPVKLSNHDGVSDVQAPVYVPSNTQTTRITTTTTTENTPIKLENIWHIIDDEKFNQFSGKWQEVQDKSRDENVRYEDQNKEDIEINQKQLQDKENEDQNDEVMIDENFALPGFATNPGSGAENESRAIRTEPNIRFPYVNLKPFQIKSSKKTLQNNHLLTSLDQFSDLRHPVRGEALDITSKSQLIDRYNPAQPYLPHQKYGKNLSKQSNGSFSSQKATANLVPPPPPPPPKANDILPAPASYDSFPPYAPSNPSFNQLPAPPPPPPPSLAPSDSVNSQVSGDSSDSISDSSDDDDRPIMDLGYRYKPPSGVEDIDNSPMINVGYQYKPPSPPMPEFFPSAQSTAKPFTGYSYNKPSMMADLSPPIEADPQVQGYHYKKPVPSNPLVNQMPQSYNPPDTYDSKDLAHSDHNSDYPELIFNKPHSDTKGDDHTNDHDIGMMPPSPASDMKPDMYGPPANDHGFPIDFPTDFKFHHDFDDHDHDHYHYHHTTTTTETPRVNRFSYYYLGKKLYYLPLYFSVYFIVYVGALIIKAVLRHKIVYPNSWRPNSTTATFFTKRSVDEFMSNDDLHDLTKKVTHAIATAAEKYLARKYKTK
ncbi:unnamed protein product [Euphydryas editha]|uniref:Uncharacterized protein n=1 Tax=Euphydryas editha TaxID=104508 RepID=A0AAU9UWL5_EUPED|nr:unnamed protein product [Euphydryas editha]